MSNNGKYLNQENIIKKVFDETEDALRVTGSISIAPTPGAATEAKQDDEIAASQDILAAIEDSNALLTQIETNTATSSGASRLEVIDISPLIDTASTNITVATPVQLIAAVSQDIFQVQSIEDIGEYMVLCVGAPGSEVDVAALPLGGGTVDVNIPSGSRISVRSLINTVSNGNLIINAIGVN